MASCRGKILRRRHQVESPEGSRREAERAGQSREVDLLPNLNLEVKVDTDMQENAKSEEEDKIGTVKKSSNNNGANGLHRQ